jgi:hypothetical protein
MNPLLKVSSWEYDVGGRKVNEIDPLGRFFTFGYDIGGNQTSVTDANANAAANPALGTTTLTYDSLNRATGRTYAGVNVNVILMDAEGGNESGFNPTGLSDKDSTNTSYCNKPYPSRSRMCAAFAKASAAALWASSSVSVPGQRNACRHCVWSYLLDA